MAMSKLLESLTPDNALTILDALKDQKADGEQWELFRYAWAVADPENAMQHALRLEGRTRRNAIEDTLAGWASRSPDEALEWVNSLENSDEQERFRGSFLEGLADHDIGQATDYVMERSKAGDKQAHRYMETVTREQLRRGSIEEAARWSEDLPDGKLKGQAMDHVAGRFVHQSPEAAAAWAAQYAEASYGARVIEEVGDEWAERDPSAAVAWLQSLPEGKGQTEGMESALEEWAGRDPTSASEFLITMGDSELKDSAVSGFARRVVREDPEAAMAWANTIDQPEMRTKTMTTAAREWLRRDREAATNWLESSNLPSETMNAILHGGKRRS
ncbi:MAG: hypothetical protein AAF514_09450 [Verrucomicrobiota bacterium]